MKTKEQKLAKLVISISNGVYRGERMNNSAQLSRVDKYNDIADSMSREEWVKYCESMGFSVKHDAYDFFA